MIVKSAEFITSAVKPSQYPEAMLPEIAFSGRSNAGKSSLINTLVNRKKLVKTSQTPGKTQLLNFFNINDAFSFVDLPGYGFAKVPASVQGSWAHMIERYLSQRDTLKGVVIIIDIRRTPDEKETDLINWLAHFNIPSIIVLSKADKLKRMKQRSQHDFIAKILEVKKDDLFVYSSKSRQGKNGIWDAIEQLIED
jgi:GTP-binding protein